MRRLSLAFALIPCLAFGATQTFYQASSFQTNVFLHDSPVALHLRLAGFLTNEPSWAASSNAVGIMITNYFPLPSGIALSNTVGTLTNDVAALKTNTATKAQGALADTALQVEADTNALFQLGAHTTNQLNPHGVTAAQVGAATGTPLYEFVEADTNALFQLGAHATNAANPHGVTAAQVGAATGTPVYTEADPVWAAWVSSNGTPATGSPLYEFTEADPAYATGAVHVTGATMTGPITNEHGYYGDGSGLTNLLSDPSAWSGYAATQQVVWYEPEIVNDTNYLVISGSSSPEVAGLYHWEEQGEFWAYRSAFGYIAPQEDLFWYIVSGSSEFRNFSADPTAGGYDAYNNATGTLLAAYGSATNAVTWRAGYDVTTNRWVISRNGANIQEWFYSYPAYDEVYTTIKGGLRVESSVKVDGHIEVDASIHTPALELNGAYRTTWPTEFDGAALGLLASNALTTAEAGSNLAYDVSVNLDTVSNWAVAGSNLAFDVAGNLSIVSNIAAAGGADLTSLSNNLSVVSNQTAAGSNLAYATAVNLDTVSNWVVAASNLAALALPTTGGTVTGNVEVKGALIASTLRLTNAPAVGSVWVATNANGSGELRVLAKMVLRPYGAPAYSGFYATNKWGDVTTSVGGLTGTVNGIKVHRDGYYHCEMLLNIGGLTNQNQYMRAQLTRGGFRLNGQYGPISASPNNLTISCNQGVVYPFNAGDVIGVQYYIFNSSVGQTNASDLGGFLSVHELP